MVSFVLEEFDTSCNSWLGKIELKYEIARKIKATVFILVWRVYLHATYSLDLVTPDHEV